MPPKPSSSSKPKTDEQPAEVPAVADVAERLRDRIVELRRVPTSELHDNPRNWRLHPYAQKQALSESLSRLGIADALIAYESERNGGRLTLIDGHLRRGANQDEVWPTLVTDLNDEEADLLLATLDPISAMAEGDPELITSLLEDVSTGTPALEDLFRRLDPGEQPVADEAVFGDVGGPREMELQAFEHYDYIVLMFRDALDWQAAKELLGIKHESFTLRDGKTRRTGLGRVVEGKRLLELMQRDES